MAAARLLAANRRARVRVTSPAGPTVSVITVTWNSVECIGPFLDSVRETGDDLPGGVETVVVDNCSSDGTRDEVRAMDAAAKLLVTHRNLGYGGAANVGLAAAKGETLLVANPDVVFQPGALLALHERLTCEPAVGCVAPVYLTAEGDTELPGRRFPTIGAALVDGTMLDRWLGSSEVLRRYYMHDTAGAEQPDWAHGACLALRACAVRSVGGFDGGYFMYAEELDLLRSLQAAGWRCAIEPRARVRHLGGHSADRDPAAREQSFFRSRYRLAAKTWGRPFAAFLRLFVAVVGLARLAEAILKLAYAPKRVGRLAEARLIARVTLWQWLGWRR